VVELDSGRVREPIILEHRRPFGFALAVAAGPMFGDVLVPTVPKFLNPAADGCVERVHLAADPPVAAGCLVDNQALGGYASGLTTGRDGAVWMAVTTGFDPDDYGPVGYAAAWDPAGGRLEEPMTGTDVRSMDVAACPGGTVAVSDATLGVRVYAGTGEELTDAPLDLGLPPVANGLVCY
jgi:hypothetical protein